MSLECSECERDARIGHNPDCSRWKPDGCICGHSTDDHVWRGPAADECAVAGCACNGFEWETNDDL